MTIPDQPWPHEAYLNANILTVFVAMWLPVWWQLKSYVRIFKGVMHGWTIRYNVNDPKAVRKANQAHRLMLQWFAKYL